MMRHLSSLFLLGTLLLAACGPAALPLSTAKPVAPADVVGRWRYPANPREARGVAENDGIVIIAFDASGTFEQTITPPAATGAAPIIHTGTWSLKGPILEVSNALLWDLAFPSTSPPSTPHWIPRTVTWQVVDSVLRPGHFAVFGGAASQDPDNDQELEKLP